MRGVHLQSISNPLALPHVRGQMAILFIGAATDEPGYLCCGDSYEAQGRLASGP